VSNKVVIVPVIDKNKGHYPESILVFNNKMVYFVDKEIGKEFLRKQIGNDKAFFKAYDAGFISLKVIEDEDSVEDIIQKGELYNG